VGRCFSIYNVVFYFQLFTGSYVNHLGFFLKSYNKLNTHLKYSTHSDRTVYLYVFFLKTRISLTSYIFRICRNFYSQKEVTIRHNDKPWFTLELRREIRKYKTVIKSKRLQDFYKFKAQRNKINNMKKYARQSVYDNGLIGNYSKTDSKSYWKLMRRLLKTSRNSE